MICGLPKLYLKKLFNIYITHPKTLSKYSHQHKLYRNFAQQTKQVRVFDRKTKYLQKERAAINPDVAVFDYIKEEIGFRISDRIFDIKRAFQNAADIGCNRGFVISHLPETVQHLTMCDISPTMLKQAQGAPGLETTKIEMDEENLDVWIDQKRYVRKKAATNKIHQRGTGGGPNKTQKFSPSEETIFQLVGMSEAVEGVPKSRCFGLSASEEMVLNEEYCPTAAGSSSDPFHYDLEVTPQNENDQPTPPTPQINKKRKAVQMSTSEVVAEELEIQKKICSELSAGISVMREHNKEVQSSFKKLYRSLDRITELKKESLKEQKRHNL